MAFSQLSAGATVLEVGAGTGNFLALFSEVAGRRIAVDLTDAMLRQARRRNPGMELVQAEGAALPIRSGSVDLACSAQTFHHIRSPMPVLKEMRRVAAPEGRVLIVDQVAPERVEEIVAMNELDVLRDPSHAACRPPSALRIMITAAGLDIEAEEVHSAQDLLSKWMSPDEFPPERIAAVYDFVEQRSAETGMAFERSGDDWVFTRKRIQILARRST